MDATPTTNAPVSNLSVQVCSIDYYLTDTIFDTEKRVFRTFNCQVPVVRIFGPNEVGVKCCLHVHGIFPYFFVGIPNALALQYTVRKPREVAPDTRQHRSADRTARAPHYNARGLSSLANEIRLSLDAAMAAAFGRFQHGDNKRSKFVHKVEVVTGRPFYGYHTAKQVFVKVSAYNPTDVRKMATQLQGGHILGRTFQCYESHVPYLLQFFVDHDICGMGRINLNSFVHRSRARDARLDGVERRIQQDVLWDATIASGFAVRAETTPAVVRSDVASLVGGVSDGQTSLPRVSWCDIEADTSACFITREAMAAELTSPRRGGNDRGTRTSETPQSQQTPSVPSSMSATNSPSHTSIFQYIPSLKEFWRQNERLRREYGITAAPLPEMSATPAKSQTKHEERYLRHFKNYLAARTREKAQGLRTDNFTPTTPSNSATPSKRRSADGSPRSPDLAGSQALFMSASQESDASQYSQEEIACMTLLESMYDPTIGIATQSSAGSPARPSILKSQVSTPRRDDPLDADSGTKVDSNLRLLCTPLEAVDVEEMRSWDAGVVQSGSQSSLADSARGYVLDESYQEESEDSDGDMWQEAAAATQQQWHDSLQADDVEQTDVVRDNDYVAAVEQTKPEAFSATPPLRKSARTSPRALSNSTKVMVLYPRNEAPSASDLLESLASFDVKPMKDPALQLLTPEENAGEEYASTNAVTQLQPFQPIVDQSQCSPLWHGTGTLSGALLRTVKPRCLEPTFHPPNPSSCLLSTHDQEINTVATQALPAGQSLHGSTTAGAHGAWRDALEQSNLRATRKKYSKYANADTQVDATAIASPSTMSTATSSADSEKNGSLKRKPNKLNHNFQHSTMKARSCDLVVLSIELICETTGHRRPDPEIDEVLVCCYCFCKSGQLPKHTRNRGVICQKKVSVETCTPMLNWNGARGKVRVVDDEQDLFLHFVKLVRFTDPDLIVGWEISRSSLGYLLKRATVVFDESYHLDRELSRLHPSQPGDARHFNDDWGAKTGSDIHIVGREVFNVWRLMRGELTLSSYSLQNVAWETLKFRVPEFKHWRLSEWMKTAGTREHALNHVILLTCTTLSILDHLDFINRTSEFAFMYGIDLLSVTTRGSQFRVEAVMLRIIRRMAERDGESFILLSPSKEQVAHQRALEVIALNLEPASKLYTAPVAVLDYQSLYPSIIISRNICFSTCLGRMTKPATVADDTAPSSAYFRRRLGVLEYYGHTDDAFSSLDAETLPPFISDNGVAFVCAQQREGVMPRMLREILTMRILIKQSLAEALARKDKTMARILNSRQLGLKLLANVTYGYTAASFSGRMPCVEIADAIVQTGRSILSDTIAFTERRWPAKVVYGDTDSVFVHLPGQSLHEAFRIGAEIASECTARHPDPVKLKLEKIYLPCILVTKKRYAGYMYEQLPRSNESAVLDMKGIHAIRRDGFPALVKVMKRCLHILFQTLDMSKVRHFVQRECSKILNGDVSTQDLIFRKEIRMNYRVRPPHAVVAAKMALRDPLAMPLYGQRVPYVIVYGSQHARVLDLAMPPEDVLEHNDALEEVGGDGPGTNLSHPQKPLDEVPKDGDAEPEDQVNADAAASKTISSIVDMAKAYWKSHGGRPSHGPAPSARKKKESAQSRAARMRQKYVLNGRFYVNRISKALDSILKLCGNENNTVDCEAWTRYLDRSLAARHRRFNFAAFGRTLNGQNTHHGSTLESYFESHNCANCFAQTSDLFCSDCLAHPQSLRVNVTNRLSTTQRKAQQIAARCCACTGAEPPRFVDPGQLVGKFASGPGDTGSGMCTSLDCPALYARRRTAVQLRLATLTARALEMHSGDNVTNGRGPGLAFAPDTGAATLECQHVRGVERDESLGLSPTAEGVIDIEDLVGDSGRS